MPGQVGRPELPRDLTGNGDENMKYEIVRNEEIVAVVTEIQSEYEDENWGVLGWDEVWDHTNVSRMTLVRSFETREEAFAFIGEYLHNLEL